MLHNICFQLGANPHQLIRTAKAKTVHVKMLLTRKNKHKRKLDNSANNNSSETETEKSMTPPFRKKGLSESEKLIRDTLLHESKTMKPEKTCLNKINGLFECYENSVNGHSNNNNDTKPIKNNKIYGRRTLSEGYYGHNSVDRAHSDLILCEIDKGYMTITFNNSRRHNLLNIDVGFFKSKFFVFCFLLLVLK